MGYNPCLFPKKMRREERSTLPFTSPFRYFLSLFVLFQDIHKDISGKIQNRNDKTNPKSRKTKEEFGIDTTPYIFSILYSSLRISIYYIPLFLLQVGYSLNFPNNLVNSSRRILSLF